MLRVIKIILEWTKKKKKARHSTNIQNRCKSPSRSYVFKKHEHFRFPYIPNNQPTRLAGYLPQVCLGCLHTPHSRTLQKCGSNRVQGLCGVEVLGRLLQHLSSLTLVSPEISTVPVSMVHSGLTSAASRPCVNWESLAKWSDLHLGSSLWWYDTAFSSTGQLQRDTQSLPAHRGAGCGPCSARESNFFLSSSFQKQVVSFLALSKK